MSVDKFVSAADAVALIRDRDTVALVGGGGGLVEASCLFELNTTDAVKRRYARKTTSDWHDKQTSASGRLSQSMAIRMPMRLKREPSS